MLTGSGNVFNAVSNDRRASQQPPIALPVASATELTVRVHLGLATSLKELGGYQVLLYLLAHVVEQRASARAQAAALDVLLQWLRSDAQQMKTFLANDGLLMVIDSRSV